MKIRAVFTLISLLFTSMVFSQLDKPQEGFSIKPSDSILKTDFSNLFKLQPILGLTNKNIERRIRYNPIEDAFKKTSGVNIAETSKLKKPTWNVKQKFTEDSKKRISI